ncbi:RNA polymerase sigma factor SigJ [Micromonospora echinofusca]|uniref:Sigma-70 family RNA polymerase sigma factor n=1 Tax=Micromonospora echinofusca TaxID=47858 RepID=A0ABS3VUT3_MICEH|nr:RNA polymerase sigma factor SigJ [Micromonospora echinofusca]MBO4208283.1 sigma-70 family RNA polymerase sigma factor [Micromonospora echinofusca]
MRELVAEFEAERAHLTAVAYRMLGSRSEAEDAVQETWLRYAHAFADPAYRAEVREPRAWLTTTTARICLDVLRSARVRRETYPGQWLPEPVVSRLPAGAATGGFAPDPAERVARTDEVGLALLVVLEQLTPEQRVAFVLHDIFGTPFAEVAAVLGTTPAAARQLASRARRTVSDPGAPRHTAGPAEQRRVVEAFLRAAESGDLAGLLAVLAPGVVLVGDSGGHFPSALRPVLGADRVARFWIGVARPSPLAVRGEQWYRPVLVNGSLGLLAEMVHRDGRLWRSVVSFAVDGGRITHVYQQSNPDKLRGVARLADLEG